MQTQQTKQITVTHTVGNTEYDFEAQITYTVDIEEGDFMHPTFSDTIIDRIEYLGETLAYSPIVEITRIVTNTVELASLRKAISWEDQLQKAL
jgi:hypothetical protein